MKSALKLKRNTLYRTTDACEYFPVGTLVKRCKWVLDRDGFEQRDFDDDYLSVVFRKKGSRQYADWNYLSVEEVEEVV